MRLSEIGEAELSCLVLLFFTSRLLLKSIRPMEKLSAVSLYLFSIGYFLVYMSLIVFWAAFDSILNCSFSYHFNLRSFSAILLGEKDLAVLKYEAST